MRALKALVIGMGLLIVAGTILVVATLVGRIGDSVGGGDAGFGRAGLGLAESCRLQATTATEAGLALAFAGPAKDGCRVVVIVDPATGRTLGRIDPHAPAVGADDGASGTTAD